MEITNGLSERVGRKKHETKLGKLERGSRLAGALLILVVSGLLAGCGGITAPEDSGSGAETERLREENDRLRAEIEVLERQVREMRTEEASAEKDEAPPETTSEPEADTEEPADEDEGGSGESLTVAGEGDVTGEPLPEILPEDFPLPAGAVADYVYEDEYSFSLTLGVDAEFQDVAAFYDEQLAGLDWEETDRSEGVVDGLEGADTTWERGTYIPADSPQESAYEQARETLYLTVYELQPSGVGVDIRWSDNQLRDEDYNSEQESTAEEAA